MKVEFLFDRKEWADTLNRLSPHAKLYWRENYKFTPTTGWCIPPVSLEGKVVVKALLGFRPKIEAKKGMSSEKPARELRKELDSAIVFTIIDRGWLPREDIRYNNRIIPSPLPRPVRQARGFIYLIRNGDLYKIGITTDLKRRLSELQPDEVVNVAKRCDYAKIEREIHQKFKRQRLPQTEYFRLTEDELAKVEALMEQR